jgi:hypothetical protein
MKNIVFIRNDAERTISIDPELSSERLQNTIKVTFGLPQSSQVALENINTNIILGGIEARYLLSDPDIDSKYRVLIEGDEQSKDIWYHRLWQQFILPFVSK